MVAGGEAVLHELEGAHHLVGLQALLRARSTGESAGGDQQAGGVQPGAMPWKNRYIGNPLLSFLGRLLFGGAIRDFHCGLRAFDAAAIRRLGLTTTGMEFASEMVVKATLSGLRVAEVPTTLQPDGRSRRPHLRSFRDGWRHLRFLLLFSPKWLFLYPGYIMLALGLFLGTLLIRGPVRVTPTIELDVHTFLVAAMLILVGLQAVMFAYDIGILKHADRLNEAVTKIDALTADFANIAAPHTHELVRLKETEAMLLAARMILGGSLERTESRLSHFREDYEARDDKNWLVWVDVAQGKDGRPAFTRTPIPTPVCEVGPVRRPTRVIRQAVGGS